jgi:hypothetical protein
MTEPVAPEAPETPDAPPSPADVASRAQPKDEPKEDPAKADWSPDQAANEIAKLRKEAAGYRTKLREAEPIIKKHQEAEEANKSEAQREREAREEIQKERDDLLVGYTRLELAAQYNIPPDEIDLIGSGSREEMEAVAARLGPLFATREKTPPPPSNRPVEGLRPGASPEPPKPADDSYPASWRPPHLQQTS